MIISSAGKNEKITCDGMTGLAVAAMNNKQDDARANLLRSLKPYMKDSKKNKIDQYIKFLSIARVFETMNPLGGDTQNE